MADVPVPCFSFDGFQFIGPNAKALRDLARRVHDVFQIDLQAYMNNAFEKAPGHPDFDPVVGIGGDLIWTDRGPGLPAAAEGGADGQDVLGHINTYVGNGQPVPEQPDGDGGAFITNVLSDPVRHTAWVERGDPVSDLTPNTTYGDAVNYINTITTDEFGQVDAITTGIPAGGGGVVYSADEVYITAVVIPAGIEFRHELRGAHAPTTWTLTHLGLVTTYYDAAGHYLGCTPPGNES